MIELVLPPGPVSGAVPACVGHDPDLWFPHDKDDYTEALRICAGCPLVAACRDQGVTRKESGVWGGVLLKRGRALAAFPEPGRPTTAR